MSCRIHFYTVVSQIHDTKFSVNTAHLAKSWTFKTSKTQFKTFKAKQSLIISNRQRRPFNINIAPQKMTKTHFISQNFTNTTISKSQNQLQTFNLSKLSHSSHLFLLYHPNPTNPRPNSPNSSQHLPPIRNPPLPPPPLNPPPPLHQHKLPLQPPHHQSFLLRQMILQQRKSTRKLNSHSISYQSLPFPMNLV